MSDLLGQKRDRVDILGDILRSADTANWKHRSMMDGRRLRAYSDFLIDHGYMLKVIEDNHISYNITDKGLELLNQIESLQSMLSITNSVAAVTENNLATSGH